MKKERVSEMEDGEGEIIMWGSLEGVEESVIEGRKIEEI